MSRVGWVERAALNALVTAEEYLDVYEITALAFNREPEADGRRYVIPAEVASVKRALFSLKRKGAPIHNGRDQRPRRTVWVHERTIERWLPGERATQRGWTPVVITGGKPR